MAITSYSGPADSGSGYIDPLQSMNAVNANKPATPQSSFDWQKFLSSPGGAALVNTAGGGLAAYGAYQQNQQNLQQNATQFAATSAQNQYNADRNASITRAQGVLNADPLGADQKFAQQNALRGAILGNLRGNPNSPGDANVAAAMGSRQSMIPQGGFDPEMVKSLYGNDATQASIAQRHAEINNLDPNAPTPNTTSMFGPEAAPYMGQMQQWAAQVQKMDATQRQAFDQQMQGYINQMVQQEQQSGSSDGFWHKFAKYAAIVGAGVATVMTAGGASPLLIAAIAAGSGAAGSWGNGASGAGVLAGGAMGAAGGYAGAKGNTGFSTSNITPSTLGKSAITNPALTRAIIGG